LTKAPTFTDGVANPSLTTDNSSKYGFDPKGDTELMEHITNRDT